MSNLLAFDCSLWLASFAFSDGKKLLTKTLCNLDDTSYSLINEISNHVQFEKSVDIIFNVGPGSFTGLRVNLAFALGFSSLKIHKFFCVNLLDLAHFLSKYLILKVGKNYYLFLEPNKNFRFLKGSEITSDFTSFLKKNCEDLFTLYCDFDQEFKGFKTLENLSKLMLDARSCWKECIPAKCSLFYGIDISFREISSSLT
ncbi:MAG: hypothetical protein NZO16_05000 [Deltaproteobacteria bacterium]|nr:hypothetical protein [Deltaproteobacteria bacterium]